MRSFQHLSSRWDILISSHYRQYPRLAFDSKGQRNKNHPSRILPYNTFETVNSPKEVKTNIEREGEKRKKKINQNN